MFADSVVPRTQTKVTSLHPVPVVTSCNTWRFARVTRLGMATASEEKRNAAVYFILKE
jgi:hypothetical protein